MSVRKIAGLVAAFSLAVGLIGSGVSAAFSSQVSAIQNIHVGTFGCAITSPGLTAAGDTVTFDAPTITSSAASNSPFDFTVTSTGTIPVVVTISATVPADPFTDILGAQPAVKLAGVGAAHTYNAGLQWPELGNTNLDQAVSITYTASCNEDHSAVAFSSGPALGASNYLPTFVNGSGFSGLVTISWSYAWGGYTYSTTTAADGSGNFGWSGLENCIDGFNVYQTTDQTVTVVATDGAHSATGTGTLLCSLQPTHP